MHCPVFPQLAHYNLNSVAPMHQTMKVTADTIAKPAKTLAVLSIFIFLFLLILSSFFYREKEQYAYTQSKAY